MKMGDHEIGIMHMDVDAEGGEKQTGQAAHGEETDKAQRVEHRCIVGDGPFVKSGGPVEDFDRRRDRDDHAQEREYHSGMKRMSGNKKGKSPKQGTDQRAAEGGAKHDA